MHLIGRHLSSGCTMETFHLPVIETHKVMLNIMLEGMCKIAATQVTKGYKSMKNSKSCIISQQLMKLFERFSELSVTCRNTLGI